MGKRPSLSGPSDNGFASLAGIAALILAALQVIPSYIPRNFWIYAIVGTCVVCLGLYGFAKVRHAVKPELARYFVVGGLLFAVTCFSGYQIYSLRQEASSLREQLAKTTAILGKQQGSKALQDYLATVVKEGDDRWNGEFESRYARLSLYLLRTDATAEHTPIEIQENLLLWRAGTAGLGRQFRGIAGLVGDMSMDERSRAGLFPPDGGQLDPERITAGYLNYIQRPLYDSDLLNKPRLDPVADDTADSIPERILVLADPAAGKTTLLERLDLVQARRARGSSAEPVPVRISLSALQQPTEEAIIARIRERLGDAYDDAINDRTLIVMIDALDECSDPVAAARAIASFVNNFDKKDRKVISRIIVTSRIRNYSQLLHKSDASLANSRFRTVILYGLDQISVEKQILTLSNPGIRAQLLLKLADSGTRGAWLQFLRLPMNYELVTAILADSGSDILPEGQAELIDRFVARRFAQKNISSADTEHCRSLLSIVAVNKLANGINNRAKTFTIADFARPNEPEPSYESLKPRIEQMLATGIISERSPQQYRFFHQNILDFFAAKGLPDVRVMEPDRSEWREIILFRSAMPDGPKLLDHILKCKEDGKEIDGALIEEVRRIVAGAAARH